MATNLPNDLTAENHIQKIGLVEYFLPIDPEKNFLYVS